MEIKVLYLILIFSIYFTYQVFCDEPLVPQIKVVGTQLTSLNPEYNTNVALTIHRKNATFNDLRIFWELKKDGPADVKLFLKVYVTDSTYQKGSLILDLVIPLCEPSEYRETLIPNVAQVPESTYNTQCIKKGIYATDMGVQSRFEVLIPDLESKGHYYRSDYVIGNNDTVVSSVTVYSEWGYLNQN